MTVCSDVCVRVWLLVSLCACASSCVRACTFMSVVVCSHIGGVQHAQRRYSEAAEMFLRQLELATRLKDARQCAKAYGSLGLLFQVNREQREGMRMAHAYDVGKSFKRFSSICSEATAEFASTATIALDCNDCIVALRSSPQIMPVAGCSHEQDIRTYFRMGVCTVLWMCFICALIASCM